MRLPCSDEVRDRGMIVSQRPPFLYLAHRLPYPPDKGDRIRSFHILRWLSRRASVHLACLADEPWDVESVRMLEKICERVEVFPLNKLLANSRMAISLASGGTASVAAFYSTGLKRTIGRWAREARYAGAMVSSSALAHYLRVRELEGTRRFIDLVDVDSQKWLDYSRHYLGPKRWLYRAEGKRLRRLECEVAEWASGVILVSEAESQLYRGFNDVGHLHTIPNGVDLERFQPERGTSWQESGCVFIGALDYYPNVHAACWFCETVWPRILARNPDASFTIVGRRPSPAVRRLSKIQGVNVVGQVADVRPFMAAASVVVVPLQLARGVQNKVLEALAMGKATVASPEALAGLQANGPQPVVRADSPGEWTEAILGLLDSQSECRRLGAEARRFVEMHHSWEHCLRPMGAITGFQECAIPARPDLDPVSPTQSPVTREYESTTEAL